MIDPRFYEALGPLTVRALAPSADIGGDPDALVSSAAPSDRAGSGDLCYYDAKRGKALESAPAACVIPPALAHLAPNAQALILAENPRAVFSRLVPALCKPRALGAERIDPTARVEEGAPVGERRLDVVLAAGGVGQHAVHVEDDQRPCHQICSSAFRKSAICSRRP